MNTEQERADLLPCPFCGESKSLIVQHCEGTIIHPAHRIYCGNCGASNGYSDRVDPVKNWNSRAALQSQDRETASAIRGDSYAGTYVWYGEANYSQRIPGSTIESARDERAVFNFVAVGAIEALMDHVLGKAIDHARRVEEKT